VQATRWSSAGAGNTLIEGPRLSAVLERRGWLPGVLRTPDCISVKYQKHLFSRGARHVLVSWVSATGAVLSQLRCPFTTNFRTFRTHVPHNSPAAHASPAPCASCARVSRCGRSSSCREPLRSQTCSSTCAATAGNGSAYAAAHHTVRR